MIPPSTYFGQLMTNPRAANPQVKQIHVIMLNKIRMHNMCAMDSMLSMIARGILTNLVFRSFRKDITKWGPEQGRRKRNLSQIWLRPKIKFIDSHMGCSP